jgi:beta-lactamase class A
MKNFLMMISFMSITPINQAQNSWKISLNRITVLTSSESNELVNIKKINSTDWKKNGYLEVVFLETTPSNWLHSLQFTDENGNQLLIKDSTTTAKIPIAALRKLFAGKKQLRINMVINPPNPMMMAPSRMLHLGTLKLP